MPDCRQECVSAVATSQTPHQKQPEVPTVFGLTDAEILFRTAMFAFHVGGPWFQWCGFCLNFDDAPSMETSGELRSFSGIDGQLQAGWLLRDVRQPHSIRNKAASEPRHNSRHLNVKTIVREANAALTFLSSGLRGSFTGIPHRVFSRRIRKNDGRQNRVDCSRQPVFANRPLPVNTAERRSVTTFHIDAGRPGEPHRQSDDRTLLRFTRLIQRDAQQQERRMPLERFPG